MEILLKHNPKLLLYHEFYHQCSITYAFALKINIQKNNEAPKYDCVYKIQSTLGPGES